MKVAELLTRLFSSYGLVDATKIAKEEKKVDLMVWNLNNPPFVVFSVVRELVALSSEGNVSKTQDQIVTIGMEMIWKTQDSETGLRDWFKRPAVDYTWKSLNPAQ